MKVALHGRRGRESFSGNDLPQGSGPPENDSRPLPPKCHQEIPGRVLITKLR
jgi:hypothetical protein